MAFSRRDFLKRSCCTAAAGFAAASFNRFGMVNALAQSAQDYKALVCIFMFGGNDSNNMIVPMSGSGYASYQQTRSVLALPQASLLPITAPSAGAFGLHSKLPEFQTLFNQKHLAVLANVGTLVRPTTRTQFRQGQVNVPHNLFSHEDQQAQMQTAALDTDGQTGWAGRTADKIQSIYGANFPIIISLAGTNIFCEGLTARSIQSSGNPTKLLAGFGSSAESQARLSALQNLLTFDSGVSLIQAASSTTTNAFQDSKSLADAIAAAPALATVFPNNGLANQLRQVAQIISVRSALGLQRQIFFVSIGGFDTQPVHECLLSGYGGNRRCVAGHQLHPVGLQPDVPARQHIRKRPRMGRSSPDSGGRGAWWRFLWHIPDTRSGRAGRRHQRRPMDSDHIARSVRRDSGQLVRRPAGRLADHLPQPGKLHHSHVEFCGIAECGDVLRRDL